MKEITNMEQFCAYYTECKVKELHAVFNKYHGLNGNRGGFTSFVADEAEKDLLVESIVFMYADQPEVTEHEGLDATTEKVIKGWIVKSHGYQAW